MTNKKESITYGEYMHIIREHERLKLAGVQFIKRRSVLKIIGGVTLISLGVATLPLPTGSFILIGLGCGLLGIGLNDYKRFKKVFKNYLRYNILKRKWLR